MKFDNYMIVTDLDDTFLGENGSYVKRNLDAIEYFKKNGGLFTAATGRDHYFVKDPMPELIELCNAPLITTNGACIYDPKTDKIERVLELPTRKVLEIIREAQKIEPDISYRVSLDNGYIYEREDKIFFYDQGKYRYLVTVDKFDNYLDERWLKVVFYGEKEKIANASKYLFSLDEPDLHFVNALEINAEILAKNATKGSKLSVLKEYLGTPELKIAAIGDYMNDYEMISSADIPATVLNGNDILKKIPGVYVTCDHKEGAIADLIEHIEKDIL